MSFVRYLKSSRNGVDEREETGGRSGGSLSSSSYLFSRLTSVKYLSSSPPAALPIFNLPKLPSSPLSSLGTLHTTCDALGVYLECTLSASSPRILPPPHKTLFDLLSVAPSTSFPCPDFDVLEHLSLSLGDGLHSSLFILADRMAHFFGHRWGIRTDANGRVCYAEEERRDKGIRNFFSEKKISILPSPPLGGGGVGMMEEGRVEAGKETEMERRVREANTTSLKKEDKLRWLLGPSYSGSASGSGSRSSDEVEEREGTKERRKSNPRVDRMENGVGSAKGSIEENLLRTAAEAEKALKRRTSELSSESSVSRRHSTTSSTGRRGYVKKRTLSEFSLQQNVVSKQATKGQLGHHSHAHSSTPSVRSISQEQLWRHDTVSVAGEGSDDRGSIRSFHTYASVQPLLGGMRNGFDKMSAREEILMEEELEGLAVGSGGGNGRRSLDSRRKFTYPESGQSSNTAKFKNVGPYLIRDGPNHPFQSLSTNDLTDLNIVNLPPTSNLLSPEEKMVLVKRSRKLQALLGATLGEDEVEHGLMGIKPEQRGALTLPLRNRRSSFPPGSPPHTPNKRLSFMSGVTDLSATSTIDASRSSRISISTNFTSRLETINEPTKARADRRKKLVKLQRFLGEQVPISLLDPSSPQILLASPSTGSPLARQASQPTPSREGDKDKKSTLFGKTFGIGKKGKGSLPPEDSLNDLASLAVGTGPWSGSQTVKVGKMERSATQGLSPHFDSLADIRRARKLEHMFGELPPEAFNSHRRLLSDTALSVPPRPASVASSVYRPSIITLNHIIDHEPEALATFINHYNDDDSDEAHGSQAHSTSRSRKDSPPRLSLSFEGSDDEWDGEIRRSMSSDGHRTNLKRAAKLANFFGTTKGEIFKQVLDDLEVAILEEDIPDEEREAVLDSLRKLRQKTVVN
ncbi:hypothetical protein BT69DRAFT_1284872 [Atractiella rhizophila]|nr:hypothetical protein BT69DRAFT_1284872 [Atractiella rhizophila]